MERLIRVRSPIALQMRMAGIVVAVCEPLYRTSPCLPALGLVCLKPLSMNIAQRFRAAGLKSAIDVVGSQEGGGGQSWCALPVCIKADPPV